MSVDIGEGHGIKLAYFEHSRRTSPNRIICAVSGFQEPCSTINDQLLCVLRLSIACTFTNHALIIFEGVGKIKKVTRVDIMIFMLFFAKT